MTSDDTVGCGQTSWEPYFALSHETMRNCPASSASARGALPSWANWTRQGILSSHSLPSPPLSAVGSRRRPEVVFS